MRRRATGIVAAITAERPGAQEIAVRLEAPFSQASEVLRPALVLTQLTGPVQVGAGVLLNTVAVELGLGTGGLDFVIAVLNREGGEPDVDAPGHILKLRYTPLQTPVLAVESPESPHHEAIQRFQSLDGLPVVCAELHSQLPLIAQGIRWGLEQAGFERPGRIVYVMTEGAALPLALSRLVPQMRERGLLDAVITSGQAFGGDYEAVNVYSALACAHSVCGADAIVVCQGPGNVGTGTTWGFSGIEQGQAVNAVDSLGGVPIVAPRLSFADARVRHQGLSHHTQTILQRVVRVPALLALPRLDGDQSRQIARTLAGLELSETLEPITINAAPALEAFATLNWRVTTMGRSLDEERPFFLAALAAGLLAAQLVEANEAS